MATDDDPQTRWGCPDDTRACWLEVDLGAPKAFGRVAINELADRIRKFTLDYRDTTDAPWQTAFAGTMAGATFQQDFPTVTGRFVRLNITEASGPPTIWEFNVHPGAPGWQRCGAWTAKSFHDGKAALSLDLSPFIPKPGQFEVKFEQTGGEQALRITKTTLLYEGEEATPGLLTRWTLHTVQCQSHRPGNQGNQFCAQSRDRQRRHRLPRHGLDPPSPNRMKAT